MIKHIFIFVVLATLSNLSYAQVASSDYADSSVFGQILNNIDKNHPMVTENSAPGSAGFVPVASSQKPLVERLSHSQWRTIVAVLCIINGFYYYKLLAKNPHKHTSI